jgi:hypothetical protein
MDAYVTVDQLHRVMAARGWRFVSASDSVLTFADAAGNSALIRLVLGDPGRALAADLVRYVRDARLAAVDGSDLVVAGDDTEGHGAVALLAAPEAPESPEARLSVNSAQRRGTSRPGRPTLRLSIEPGSATQADVQALLTAISDLNRALGGAGIDFRRLDDPDGGTAASHG